MITEPTINLVRAFKAGQTDFAQVLIKQANLQAAFLPFINLEKASLQQANMRHSVLPGANLQGADLERSILEHANLLSADLNWANLNQANLDHVLLSSASLVGTNLTGASLAGANLANADLRSANLRNANLVGANLKGTNLSRANLFGARVDLVSLSGANLDFTVLPNGNCNSRIKDPTKRKSVSVANLMSYSRLVRSLDKQRNETGHHSAELLSKILQETQSVDLTAPSTINSTDPSNSSEACQFFGFRFSDKPGDFVLEIAEYQRVQPPKTFIPVKRT